MAFVLVLAVCSVVLRKAQDNEAAQKQTHKAIKGMQILKKDINEENKKRHYSIHFKYPQIKGMTNKKIQDEVNGKLKALADAAVKDFRNEMQDAGEPDKELGAEMMENFLESDFSTRQASPFLFSVEFLLTSYYAGAAHPGHETRTVNFNLKTGNIIKLPDIFKPGSDYLKVLSDYCVKELKQVILEQGIGEPDENWIKEGTSPKPENFTAFILTQDGIAVTFDEYQVAPYVMGGQEVEVPYDELKDVLAPESPVAPLIK